MLLESNIFFQKSSSRTQCVFYAYSRLFQIYLLLLVCILCGSYTHKN